jgi:hypothetical protein
VDGRRADETAFTTAAAKLGIPLTIVKLDTAAARNLYPTSLTLIRPDQHVAWRGSAPPADLEGLLNKARGGEAMALDQSKWVAVGGSHELVQ